MARKQFPLRAAGPRDKNKKAKSQIGSKEGKMAESVYKVIELVGTSTESWEKAATAAVNRASKSLRDLRIAEISALSMGSDRILCMSTFVLHFDIDILDFKSRFLPLIFELKYWGQA